MSDSSHAAGTSAVSASVSAPPSHALPAAIHYPPLSATARERGRATIVGFGSLLSSRSAAATFATIFDFRPGVIKGWRRMFAHIAPIFIERGIANKETLVRLTNSATRIFAELSVRF